MKTKDKNNNTCSSSNKKLTENKKKRVTEKDIEEEVKKMNPDENSMESRG